MRRDSERLGKRDGETSWSAAVWTSVADDPVRAVRRASILLLLLGAPILGLNYYIEQQKAACGWLWRPIASALGCPSLAMSTSKDQPSIKSVAVSDARQLLKSWDYSWTEESFWTAVSRIDTKAIALFLNERMIISADKLHSMLRQPMARKGEMLSALLVDAQNHNAEFCSVSQALKEPQRAAAAQQHLDSFASFLDDSAVVDFVKAFCRGHSISEALRIAVSEEEARNARIASKNDAAARERVTCNAELASHDVRLRLRFLTESEEAETRRPDKAAKVGDLLPDQPCHSPASRPRTPREAELCRWLTDSRNVSVGWKWVPTVKRFCDQSAQVLPIDTSRRDRLEKAARVYDR